MTAKLKPFTVYLANEDAVHNLDEGQRLATVKWRLTAKAEKEGKIAQHPVIVSIPAISLDALDISKDHCLYAVMQAAINEMQDAMVTEAINAMLSEGRESKQIIGMMIDLDVSEAGIAAWHANKAMNGRLSGDAIKAWFAEYLADEIGVALIEKGLITEGENEKLAAIVADYQSKFVKLASPKAAMPEALVKQLQRALQLAPDDKVKSVLAAKLQGFLKPAEEAISVAL